MKHLVLLSGGLDSTVNLYAAHRRGGVALAITFDYGQRAAAREVSVSRWHCRRLGAPHRTIRLPWFATLTGTALVARRRAVPRVSLRKLESRRTLFRSANAVWVPNRNGVFLAVAAAIAEAKRIPRIVTGFNAEEAQTFPDNSTAFLAASNRAFAFSTRGSVRAISYTGRMRKAAIARFGLRLQAPIFRTHPCYLGGRNNCRSCESCVRFTRATRGLPR